MQMAEIESKILALVKERAPLADGEINRDEDLKESYGVDSIVLVELLVEVEEMFGIAFDSSELSGDVFRTAGTIADYVYAKIGTGTEAEVS